MYSELSDRLGVVWMNRGVEGLHVDGRWQALARGNLRNDFYRIRREFALRLLKTRSRRSPANLFAHWLDEHVAPLNKYDAILEEMQRRNDVDFATLSVAAQELRKLTDY